MASYRTIGLEFYSETVATFPIVCFSDEFFYFPQVENKDPDWRVWDRFHPDVIADYIKQLASWEYQIDGLLSTPGLKVSDALTEMNVLRKMMLTLREQLDFVRVWERQPSFYLTITCIGLAQALDKGAPQARQRAETLPEFLDMARQNLQKVPQVFQHIGLGMVSDTREYLLKLLPELPALSNALDSLERFEKHLTSTCTTSNFRLPEEIIGQIVQTHMNCGMDVMETREVLDGEVAAMTRALTAAAEQMGENNWEAGYKKIPLPIVGADGLEGLYRNEVQQLGRHCYEAGLVIDPLYHDNPVRVMPVPAYLSAIRAASSYSIMPGHPSTGGTFYVINATDSQEAKKDYNIEYQILAAHETWPGHHLLDISRWCLASPILRAVEQPVFYEGWACFAEEMMFMTGYLQSQNDRLILAKRRLWRAVRGKVDLGLQTGTMSIQEAATLLAQTGMTKSQGMSSAQKYLLNPGYQLCYTIGFQRFRAMYEQFGAGNLVRFSRTVLQQGEICFEDLETILQNRKQI